MNADSGRNFLLYLKALVWSIFVSYSNTTVELIVRCLRQGEISNESPDFQHSHLGLSLKFIVGKLPRLEDRECLARCLERVKLSDTSLIYRNMVFEMGHYVTTLEKLGDVEEGCAGVVYYLKDSRIAVIFRKEDQTLSAHEVIPSQVLPVYTLTIPETSA